MTDPMTPTSDLPTAPWRISSYSGANGSCVEVAPLTGHRMAVRHSKDRTGPALIFTEAEWAAFVGGIRAGEFDDLAG